MDRHETLREPIQDDIDSESPPKSICGGCIKRNGRSGRVLEASWRHRRLPSGPLGPFRGPPGTIMDRHEFLRERIQEDLDSESPPKPFFEDVPSETVVLRKSANSRRRAAAIEFSLASLLSICYVGRIAQYTPITFSFREGASRHPPTRFPVRSRSSFPSRVCYLFIMWDA